MVYNVAQLRDKGIYFARKTQGNPGKMKLEIGIGPVIVNWGEILF